MSEGRAEDLGRARPEVGLHEEGEARPLRIAKEEEGEKRGAEQRQGVRQDATGRFVVDRSAYEPGGAIIQWLDLAARRPGVDVGTLMTSSNISVAQEIFNVVDVLNEAKDQNEKRWGVRPHKISLFTAYELREGRLRGFTVGGGWRWRSANTIGANSAGREITGREIAETDFMLAYTRKIGRVPGRFRFQLNVTNVLNKTDIIPVRIATSEATPDGFIVPGGRGLGYSRYDLVTPREFRFTTTWSY